MKVSIGVSLLLALIENHPKASSGSVALRVNPSDEVADYVCLFSSVKKHEKKRNSSSVYLYLSRTSRINHPLVEAIQR